MFTGVDPVLRSSSTSECHPNNWRNEHDEIYDSIFSCNVASASGNHPGPYAGGGQGDGSGRVNAFETNLILNLL